MKTKLFSKQKDCLLKRNLRPNSELEKLLSCHLGKVYFPASQVTLHAKWFTTYFTNVFITSFVKEICEKFWFAISEKHVEITLQDVLIRKLNNVTYEIAKCHVDHLQTKI